MEKTLTSKVGVFAYVNEIHIRMPYRMLCNVLCRPCIMSGMAALFGTIYEWNYFSSTHVVINTTWWRKIYY